MKLSITLDTFPTTTELLLREKRLKNRLPVSCRYVGKRFFDLGFKLFSRLYRQVINQQNDKLHKSSCILIIQNTILTAIRICYLSIRKLYQCCKIPVQVNCI